MTKGRAVQAFWDPAQLLHTPQFFLQRGQVRPNFERKERAWALMQGLQAARIPVTVPGPALYATPRSALEAVHDGAYLDFLEGAHAAWSALPDAGPELVPNIHPSPEMLAHGAVPGGLIGQLGWFTADTSCPIGAGTWDAALAAARCALAAADVVATGQHAYALTRPPGHHAYPGRAGGHCYLNNAAIAAERLLARGARRVGILDIDSHHGNGTQGAFWTRDDVVFASVHGDPGGYYPWYVGHASEQGAGPGHGHNLNLPLPFGTPDGPWLEAVGTGLTSLAACDALVLSLGFDASDAEPLAFLRVTADGFARAADCIAAAGKPTCIVQEGGYNTETLGPLLARFLGAFQ